MNNPFKTLQEKLKNAVAKLKPAPETKSKILSRSGYTLLAGAGVGFVALVMGPASIAVAAGAATLGMMGVGFGLIQEGDNVKYQIARKNQPPAEIPAAPKAEAAPAVEAPSAEKKAEVAVAPVTETAPAVIEKKADIAAAVQPAVEFAAAAKKADAPAPAAVAPAAAPEAKPETKPEAPKP